MSAIEDKVNQRIKCRAYKNEENPDGRESLCGEPVQIDKRNGREFFLIPGHQREYLSKLMPSYEFTESFDISDEKPPVLPKKDGRRKAAAND
jgi:hypothetical protein